MRTIQFNRLFIKGFKAHEELTLNFADYTKIEGRNGQGKSSIAESITWLFWGIDPMGSKIEPTPHNTNEDTVVQLLLTVDGKQILLGRGIEKNKNDKFTNKFYVNEVSKKATEFDSLIAELFDKDLFLSVFNPSYFSSQHWEKQRKQLLQYVSEPLDQEVLVVVSEADRSILAEGLKKYSLEDLEQLNRDKFNKMDREMIRAQERVKVLKEQLDKAKEVVVESANPEEISRLEKEIQEYQARAKENTSRTFNRESLIRKLDNLKTAIQKDKSVLDQQKNRTIKEDCHACGQKLKDEAIQKAKEHHLQVIHETTEEIRKMIEAYKEIQAEIELTPSPEPLDDIFDKQQRLAELKAKVNANPDTAALEIEIKNAQDALTKVIHDKNLALSTIDAVKEFKNKRYELMAKKVSDLFNRISIKLFHVQKNDEIKATFEVEMDGKPYSKLSTAEKIKAGMEISKVLSTQSGLIVPTFIDNKEVILEFETPVGQLITASVVDCELTIEGRVKQ